MTRSLLLAGMAWLLTACGQKVPTDLDSGIQELMTDLECPGALVAFTREGHPPEIRAYGVADIETEVPMPRNAHMRIGSVSKPFVGTLILLLAEEGSLSLDHTIDQYVEGIPNGNDITLRQLGNHTSGLPQAISNREFQATIAANPEKVWKVDEILEFALAQEPHFPPGSSWRYSNTNTLLLALAAETATGKSLQSLLQRYLFEPLALSQTGLDSGDDLPNPRTSAYRHGREKNPIRYGKTWFDVTNYNTTFAFASGNLYSTIDDLHRATKPIILGELLSEASRHELHGWTKARLWTRRYGFCLSEWDEFIGHRGDVPGYQAVAAWHEETRTAITVLTNLSNAQNGKMPANEIADLLIAWIKANPSPEPLNLLKPTQANPIRIKGLLRELQSP